MTRITLATLPHATEQQVFDQVAAHLLTQMRKSRDLVPTKGYVVVCRYRSVDENGTQLSCAAGSLIGDHEYTPLMDGAESTDWASLFYDEKLVPFDHMLLIESLQRIHDRDEPEEWEHALSALARMKGLDPGVVSRTLSANAARATA